MGWKKCCVPNCASPRGTTSVHQFPSDLDIKRKWIDAIIANLSSNEYACFRLYESSVVCGDHFVKDEDFRETKYQYSILKKGAVPSIFAKKQAENRKADRDDNSVPETFLNNCAKDTPCITSEVRMLPTLVRSLNSINAYSSIIENQIDWGNRQPKDEEVAIDFDSSGNAQINLSQHIDPLSQEDTDPNAPILLKEDHTEDPLSSEDTSANTLIQQNEDIPPDPLKQDSDYGEDSSMSLMDAPEINSVGPNMLDFVKVDMSIDPFEIQQEENASQCTDPLEKASVENFGDDFLELVRVESCEGSEGNPVKTRKRRKRLELPPKERKPFKVPKTEKLENPMFGLEVNQLNGTHRVASNLAKFEVKALPTFVENDGSCQKIVLEINVKPMSGLDNLKNCDTAAREDQINAMTQRIQRLVDKDIHKSNKIDKLQKIIRTQKKKIAQLNQTVNDYVNKVINEEHDYGMPQ